MSVVKINLLSVKDGQNEELERRFAARRHAFDQVPGYEGFDLLRPVAGDDRYYVVTRWADQESFEAWQAQRVKRDPSTTVSEADAMLEFELVDLD